MKIWRWPGIINWVGINRIYYEQRKPCSPSFVMPAREGLHWNMPRPPANPLDQPIQKAATPVTGRRKAIIQTTKQPVRLRRKSKLSTLLKFDAAILQGLSAECRLIGLDEVGRGSLVGSVIGGAVCLPRSLSREQRKLLNWLDDSKKLTAPVRAELSEAIQSFCLTGLGEAERHEVDSMNIHFASLLALYRALEELCRKAEVCHLSDDIFVVMDGKAVIPDFRANVQRAVIKGDGSSAAIAAASIIAKHHRDSMIKTLAKNYPGYGWEVNMGYPTPAHLKGLRELGLTPLHRTNFKKVHEQLPLPFSSL